MLHDVTSLIDGRAFINGNMINPISKDTRRENNDFLHSATLTLYNDIFTVENSRREVTNGLG